MKPSKNITRGKKRFEYIGWREKKLPISKKSLYWYIYVKGVVGGLPVYYVYKADKKAAINKKWRKS